MKLNNRIVLTLALSAAMFSVSALAQDAPPPPDKPMHHHHHKAAEEKVSEGGKYGTCVKQKMAVAEYFCSIHSDSCKAEKDGVGPQCRSEVRGERQKG